MAIYLSNRQKALPIKDATLKRRLGKILKELNLSEAHVSISITDDAEIQDINQQYRGVNAPTNVLAFAMEEGPEITGGTHGPRILGDVVISGETILAEAPTMGYTDGEMFYFYLVHGLLHLLGYDHEKSTEEATRQEDETERLWNLIRHDL